MAVLVFYILVAAASISLNGLVVILWLRSESKMINLLYWYWKYHPRNIVRSGQPNIKTYNLILVFIFISGMIDHLNKMEVIFICQHNPGF